MCLNYSGTAHATSSSATAATELISDYDMQGYTGVCSDIYEEIREQRKAQEEGTVRARRRPIRSTRSLVSTSSLSW